MMKRSIVMGHKYRCERCHEDCEADDDWTDDDVQKEYEENFPISHASGEELAEICDDCYNEMIGDIKEEAT